MQKAVMILNHLRPSMLTSPFSLLSIERADVGSEKPS